MLTHGETGAELLEREGALATLEAALTGITGGGGRLLFVSGEAGVGKTTLLHRFCDLRNADTRLLWGGCDGLRTPPPLGPFLDIGATVGGRLAEALHEASKPHLVFDALLEELEVSNGTVIVLEDLHWADEATLDLLAMVGRRVERLNALVVATHRSDELSREHPLRILIGELTTTRRVQRSYSMRLIMTSHLCPYQGWWRALSKRDISSVLPQSPWKSKKMGGKSASGFLATSGVISFRYCVTPSCRPTWTTF